MATIANLPNSYYKQETNPERLELATIRCKGNNVQVKCGARRCRDDRDADEGKTAAGTLAKPTSADNPRYKKVFKEKQWNDGRRNGLVNLDDKIVLRGAGVVQNMANSRKETTKAVPEIQRKKVLQSPGRTANRASGTAGPSKGLQQIKTKAGASAAKAHKHSIARTQREAAVAEEAEELGKGERSKSHRG